MQEQSVIWKVRNLFTGEQLVSQPIKRKEEEKNQVITNIYQSIISFMAPVLEHLSYSYLAFLFNFVYKLVSP